MAARRTVPATEPPAGLSGGDAGPDRHRAADATPALADAARTRVSPTRAWHPLDIDLSALESDDGDSGFDYVYRVEDGGGRVDDDA